MVQKQKRQKQARRAKPSTTASSSGTSKSRRKSSGRKRSRGNPFSGVPNAEVLKDLWEKARVSEDKTPNPHDIADGIHEGIEFTDYTRINAVNFSTLILMKSSGLHFRYTPRRDESPALALGTLLHQGKLEPEMLAKRYVVIPEEQFISEVQSARVTEINKKTGKPYDPYSNVKATTAYKDKVKEFMKSHMGKQEVSAQWFMNTIGVLKSLNEDERCQEYFSEGAAEVVLVWTDPETGIRCKARLDFVNPGGWKIVDLKTTAQLFRWYLEERDTHCQLAWYQRGWEALTGDVYDPCLIVQESEQPYAVQAAPIDEEALGVGRSINDKLLKLVEKGRRTRKWKGPKNPVRWCLGKYYDSTEWEQHHNM